MNDNVQQYSMDDYSEAEVMTQDLFWTRPASTVLPRNGQQKRPVSAVDRAMSHWIRFHPSQTRLESTMMLSRWAQLPQEHLDLQQHHLSGFPLVQRKLHFLLKFNFKGEDKLYHCNSALLPEKNKCPRFAYF